MPFILGNDMKSLKEIPITDPKAGAADTLVDGRMPRTVAEDKCVGHIVMTRHTEIYNVVLLTGQVFPFDLRKKCGPSM